MSIDASAAIKVIPADGAMFAKVLALRPVLWVGAGLSIGAGYPSTGKIVDALAAAAHDPIDKQRSFYEVVDAVVASVGKGRVRDVLQGLFQPARPPTPSHRAIARLARAGRFAAIITTNYDDLLERSLAEAGAPYVLQPLEDNATVTGDGVRLLKVHGSYDDWKNVVLSGDSYARFGKQYPFLRAQLAVLQQQQPVLLAGCSLQDPRLLDWIAALSDDAADGLKEWRSLMTAQEWQSALAHTHEGTPVGEILARAPLRPLIVRDHEHARELFVEAAGALATAAEVVTLDLTVTGEALSAAMAGAGAWTPVQPLRDGGFVAELRDLRELDHHPLPLGDRGELAPLAAGVAATIRALAERVGGALTGMLGAAAQQKLGLAVAAWLAPRQRPRASVLVSPRAFGPSWHTMLAADCSSTETRERARAHTDLPEWLQFSPLSPHFPIVSLLSPLLLSSPGRCFIDCFAPRVSRPAIRVRRRKENGGPRAARESPPPEKSETAPCVNTERSRDLHPARTERKPHAKRYSFPSRGSTFRPRRLFSHGPSR